MDVVDIDYLPNDILIKIFSYFDEITILRGRCVNKLWNNILCDSDKDNNGPLPIFNVWNPRVNTSPTEYPENYLRVIFLEACRRGSTMWIKCLSKLISNNLENLDCCSYDLWTQGFVISAKYNHLEIVKIISTFGVSSDIYEALEVAVKNDNHEIVDFLMNEFSYNRHRLYRAFNQN